MQLSIYNLKFWLVIILIGIAISLIQHKFQRKQLSEYNPFPTRPPISPRAQLITQGFDERYVNHGVAIWNELALAYQIDPTQLRVDDKIADMVKRDWFGDSGLSIESKLNAIGGAPLPEDATVFDLVLLLASQEHKHS